MKTPIRVLLLADAGGAQVIVRELRRALTAVRCTRVATVSALLEALQSPVWDVLVYVPGPSVPDVLAVLACVRRPGRALPVVLLTRSKGPVDAAATAALPSGVWGRLRKAPLSRLGPVVRLAHVEAAAERRRLLTEKKLRLFEEALGALSQGILIAEARPPDYPIDYVNPALARLTGLPAEALTGRALSALFGPGTVPTAAVRESLREARPAEAEWRHERPDGTAVWLGMTLKPIRDEAARLTHFLALVIDQSARQRLREQLRAARPLGAFGRLARSVAGEMNDLLAAMRGSGERFLSEDRPANVPNESLLQILEAGMQAETLAQLLRTDGGSISRVPEGSDLNAVVGETLGRLRGEIGQGVEVSLALKASAPVRADARRVRDVFTNLLLYARSALPHGGRLSVQTDDVFRWQGSRLVATDSAGGWFVELDVSHDPAGPNGAPPAGPGPCLDLDREFIREVGELVEVGECGGSGGAVRVFLPCSARPRAGASE